MRNKYNSDAALAQLSGQKAEIETEVGQSLIWDANPDAQDKLVAIYRDVDLKNREQWPGYTAWMVDMTEKFRKAFGPRVKKLDLEATEEPGEEPEE